MSVRWFFYLREIFDFYSPKGFDFIEDKETSIYDSKLCKILKVSTFKCKYGQSKHWSVKNPSVITLCIENPRFKNVIGLKSTMKSHQNYVQMSDWLQS